MPGLPGLVLRAMLALPASGAALAAEVTSADRTAISACLAESVRAPRACIGSIAVLCARQAPGDRREGEIECSRREAAVWRERLDAAAALLEQRLDAGPRSRFAAVQRTWESFSAQKCAFIGDVQSAARASVMQAGCELNEVAGRAIEVARLTRWQADSRAVRPRIER